MKTSTIETHNFKVFLTYMILELIHSSTAKTRPDYLNRLAPSSPSNNTLFIEASWDTSDQLLNEAAVQAGESVSFLCRIWQPLDRGAASVSTSAGPSVFLYCPMSVAYCAQDCLSVNHDWPMECTRQYRSYQGHRVPKRKANLYQGGIWKLQEVIYTIKLVTMRANGFWSCSHAGLQSEKLMLRVRDRPVLLKFTSEPPSPVLSGTPVNLTCEAAPSPNAPWYHFIWRRLGSRIPPAHSTVRLSDTVSVLTLFNTRPSDDGRYTCHVTQDLDQFAHQPNWDEKENRDESFDSVKEIERTSPDTLHLNLDVFHPPVNISIQLEPEGPHYPGQVITLICRINGGKPVPIIHFYRRISETGEESIDSLEIFNSSATQRSILSINGTRQLRWIVRETDHQTRMGCAASGQLLKTRMLSETVRLSVIFPPGPPILTALPHTAVSENRTQTYTCRSSRGSNPAAAVHWRLIPTVDYVTSSRVLSNTASAKDLGSSALVRLLSGTAQSVHMLKPGDLAEFNTDGIQQGDVSLDPANRGHVAYSEARLLGRPWFNGAQVMCYLDWKPPTTGHNLTEQENLLAYKRPSYHSVEILFAPSAVSMSVIPRSGVQELHGHQSIECTTTSSNPAAKIQWFKRPASSLDHSEVTSLLEDPLELREEDALVEDNTVLEKLPGLYGGQRVVSTLKLSNMSRKGEGTLYLCRVTHVEWVKSIGRIHRLTVLYPPTLELILRPSKWQERRSSSETSIECIPSGGRPEFPRNSNNAYSSLPQGSPINAGQTLRNKSQTLLDSGRLWRFTWSFQPTYPEQVILPGGRTSMIGSSEQVSFTQSKDHHSLLVLTNPGRHSTGRYKCHLDGPGGSISATTQVEFPFPPELASPGVTVFTAPEGLYAVIELQLWMYPYPDMTPQVSQPDHGLCLENIPSRSKQPRGTDQLNVSWYKVSSSGDTATKKRHLLSTEGPRIWSDFFLVDLATRLGDSSQNSEKRESIPTMIFRLIFTTTHKDDYGEYECEVDHVTGNRVFKTRLQMPANAEQIHLTRLGSVVHLSFDPKILQPDSIVRSALLNKSNQPPTIIPEHVLLRVCPLVSNSSLGYTSQGQLMSCHHFSSSVPSSSTCSDWVLEDPQSGFAVIDLSRGQQSELEQREVYEAQFPVGKDGVGRPQTTVVATENQPLMWMNVTKVMYHFRVYSAQGNLLHATEWFYHTMEPHFAQPASAKSLSTLTLTTLLIGIVLVTIVALIPLLLIHRRRVGKQRRHAQVCLPANNSFDQTNGNLFPRTMAELKPESFYVANMSVVDNPCTMTDHLSRSPEDHLFKHIDPPNDTVCSPADSLQLLSRVITKDGTSIYVLNNHGSMKSIEQVETNLTDSRRTSLDENHSFPTALTDLRQMPYTPEHTPNTNCQHRRIWHPISPNLSAYHHSPTHLQQSPLPSTHQFYYPQPTPKFTPTGSWIPIGTVSCSQHDKVLLTPRPNRCISPTHSPMYLPRLRPSADVEDPRAFINYVPQYTNHLSPLPNRGKLLSGSRPEMNGSLPIHGGSLVTPATPQPTRLATTSVAPKMNGGLLPDLSEKPKRISGERGQNNRLVGILDDILLNENCNFVDEPESQEHAIKPPPNDSLHPSDSSYDNATEGQTISH